jgi:hypothetical protein
MTPLNYGPENAEMIRTLSILLPLISLTLAVLIGWRKYVSRDNGALKETVEKIKMFFWGDKLQVDATAEAQASAPEASSTPQTPPAQPQWLDMDLYGPKSSAG